MADASPPSPVPEQGQLVEVRRRQFVVAEVARVADRDLVFVSSAHLTAYAMEANMELGVLIRGGLVPQRIAAHFEQLMSQGILELRD